MMSDIDVLIARLRGSEWRYHDVLNAATELESLQRRVKELEAARTLAATPAPMSAFDQFWSAYPCKKGKPVAEKAFKKVAGEFCAIMEGLEAYKRHKPDYADWLHPSTFLNQRRWEDEYDAPATGRTHDTRKDGLALLLQEANRREVDEPRQGQVAGNVVQLLPRADVERGGDEGESGDVSDRSAGVF